MLALKITLCILVFILSFLASISYDSSARRTSSNILRGIAVVLGITFCVLLITTNWNLFTIPKIILFISVFLILNGLFIFDTEFPIAVGIVITVIAYIIAGIKYCKNIETCITNEIETRSIPIMCSNDTSSVTGSMVFLVGYISEESVYKYYYQLEDGGFKQGSIPADSTTIYYIKPGEGLPHIEIIITTTSYKLNHNNNPATRYGDITETTYKLYVPEGSISNEYIFDAN